MRKEKLRTISNLNRYELRSLYALSDRIELWRMHFEERDVALNYGNGSISEQLAGAACCLEMILQEVNDLPF